jgi:hypothetical protein
MFTLRAGVISQDPSWENIGAAIWSCVELNVSIIASTLPTLRPLIVRILPGIGLSSAGNERTAYLRYGSESAAIRAGAFTTSGRRKATKIESISTEELALQGVKPGPDGGAYMYAHASADRDMGFYNKGDRGDIHIIRTTEISVDSHAR